jgi:cytochrome c-type biogenesis protein CcmH/NrfG
LEDDQGRLAEAEKLYRQGKNIPKIIDLLTASIAINPIHSRKWEYLGGALMASGRTGVALIAYVQSLRINPKNSFAWKGLRSCCEKCGLLENAKGLSWYLRMRDIEAL